MKKIQERVIEDLPVKIKEYILTDPSCGQYRKNLGDRVFSLIQWDEIPDGTYEIYAKKIDLKNYTNDEIENFITAYYKSMKELIKSCKDMNNFDTDGIIAECIFEQIQWCDADENWNVRKEREAQKVILEWLQMDKNEYKFWHEKDFQTVKNLANTNKTYNDVLAVLEYPYVDIELTDRGIEKDQDGNAKHYYDYFCCIKHEDNQWESNDVVAFVKQPHELNDWEELEKDMNEQLLKFVQKRNLNLYQAN